MSRKNNKSGNMRRVRGRVVDMRKRPEIKRVHAVGSLPRCGPCGKVMFISREAAAAGLADEQAKSPGQCRSGIKRPVRYYLAKCGFYHLTSWPHRLDNEIAA